MLLANKLGLRFGHGFVAIVCGTVVLGSCAGTWAQNTSPQTATRPSQNYVPSTVPPPSVHIPERSAKPLRNINQREETQRGESQLGTNRVVYSLGDETNSQTEQRPGFSAPRDRNSFAANLPTASNQPGGLPTSPNNVALTSFQVPDKNKSVVPDILVGSEKLLPPSQAMEAVRTQQLNVTQPVSSPAVNRPAVGNQAVNSQAVNSQAVNSQAVNNQAVNSQAVNSQAVNSQAVNSQAVNSQAVNSQAVNSQAVNNQADQSFVPRAQTPALPNPLPQNGSPLTNENAGRLPGLPPTVQGQPTTGPANSGLSATGAAPTLGNAPNLSNQQLANPVVPSTAPASIPATSTESGQDTRITLPPTLDQSNRSVGGFPVSTQQPFGSPPANTGFPAMNTDRPVDPNSPEIRLAMPAIEIEAFGPRTVGIYKASKYKIIARNLGSQDAEKVTVNIVVPQWIQVENLNASIGRKDLTNDQTNNKIQWTIDRLVAGAEQTLILDMTAIKADRFALQLDCSLQPQVGVAHVEVTEPRLEMKIAGPNEVLFGETATYNVVVRNPGTGTAENVTVMLPEALGGERATLGDIEPGKERKFAVELLARTAGQLDLATTAAASANLQTADTISIMVRRPALQVAMAAPEMVFSGTVAQIDLQISNTGDAMAREIVAAVALPAGVKYLNGIEAAEVRDETIRWNIGNLDVGEVKKFTAYCELVADGTIKLELAARGAGDIGAATQSATLVETVPDMTLSVDEPAGPLPTGKNIEYVIRVKNRGSKAAKQLNLVMLFGQGVDPVSATGLNYNLAEDGQVIFNPIEAIAPGEELSIRVSAQAHQPGTHLFRIHLESVDKDTRKVFEGTTKFYGSEIKRASTATNTDNSGFKQ